MNTLLSDWAFLAKEIALEGGEILKKYWGHVRNVQNKSTQGDLVTEADKDSETFLIQKLQTHFPQHGILAEESGGDSIGQKEFQWIIDPLDGTTNFTHQFPFVAISLGLVYQAKPILGVVYNPIMNELFMAAEGRGAYLNDRPIQVSSTPLLEESLLASGFSYDRRERQDNNYKEFCEFTNLTQGVRRAGAASLDLASVALGRLDGYWEKGLKAWDIAAGIILVREAGGIATDYDLSPVNLESGRILASNGYLHQQMSQTLDRCQRKE